MKWQKYYLKNENLPSKIIVSEAIEDKSILEEVIYSISLSVRDNYDVKEVNIKIRNIKNNTRIYRKDKADTANIFCYKDWWNTYF